MATDSLQVNTEERLEDRKTLEGLWKDIMGLMGKGAAGGDINKKRDRTYDVERASEYAKIRSKK